MRTRTARQYGFDIRAAETHYLYTDIDFEGSQLEDKTFCKVIFPDKQLLQVNGFCSVTILDEYPLIELKRA